MASCKLNQAHKKKYASSLCEEVGHLKKEQRNFSKSI
jgi:hypothetical protein